MNCTDRLTRVATGLTVAALAGVAGAISFSHMSALALEHGQLGWKSTAFPISVDGLELVSSLYILAQRRAGRRAGFLPWVALLVGTAASLAANVAVGGPDPVGRALAGWPAISLLASIKLLFSMFDHDKDDHRTTRDDQRTVPDRPSVPGTVPGTVPADTRPSGTTNRPGTDNARPSATGTDGAPDAPGAPAPGPGAASRGGAPLDIRDVADLIPTARAGRDALAASGHTLSRDRLADRMRDRHGVSNARAGLLVKILKAEDRATRLDRSPIDPSHVVQATEAAA
jgi:uncharacterized protein DUF2637